MPRHIQQQTQKKHIGVRKINKSKKNVMYGIGGGLMDLVIYTKIDTSEK